MCIRDSGYIEGVMAPDGEEQDAYILGVNEPVKKFTGKITVSYTHLDVYKRQVLNIAAKLSKGEGLDSEMKLTEPLNVIYQSARCV